MNGIALTVLLSQLPKLFGFSVEREGPLRQAVGHRRSRCSAGSTNSSALAVGGGTLALILLLKRRPRVPGHPDRRRRRHAGRRRVRPRRARGRVRARPAAAGPARARDSRWIALRRPRAGAHRAAARSRSSRSPTRACCRAPMPRDLRTPVDPNQEMVGLGVANLAAGFFQGFPISSSSSRTPVAEAAGAKTQLTGVVGAAGDRAAAARSRRTCSSTCRTPRWPPSSSRRPSACSRSPTCARIYRIQRWEFWLSMACFAGVAVLGAIPGIGLAIVIAVIEFLWDGWRPHFGGARPRRRRARAITMSTAIRDARLDPGARAVPLGCAAVLRQRRAVPRARAGRRGRVADAGALARGGGGAGDQRRRDRGRRRSPSSTRRCTRPGIELCFAEMKDPVKDKLKRFGLSLASASNASSRPSARR